eukprot:COSAG01_NODE_2172_length_8232_cov_45.821222_3_plen_167_part_01
MCCGALTLRHGCRLSLLSPASEDGAGHRARRFVTRAPTCRDCIFARRCEAGERPSSRWSPTWPPYAVRRPCVSGWGPCFRLAVSGGAAPSCSALYWISSMCSVRAGATGAGAVRGRSVSLGSLGAWGAGGPLHRPDGSFPRHVAACEKAYLRTARRCCWSLVVGRAR